MRSTLLGVDTASLDLSSSMGAQAALDPVDTARDTVATDRARLMADRGTLLAERQRIEDLLD